MDRRTTEGSRRILAAVLELFPASLEEDDVLGGDCLLDPLLDSLMRLEVGPVDDPP